MDWCVNISMDIEGKLVESEPLPGKSNHIVKLPK